MAGTGRLRGCRRRAGRRERGHRAGRAGGRWAGRWRQGGRSAGCALFWCITAPARRPAPDARGAGASREAAGRDPGSLREGGRGPGPAGQAPTAALPAARGPGAPGAATASRTCDRCALPPALTALRRQGHVDRDRPGVPIERPPVRSGQTQRHLFSPCRQQYFPAAGGSLVCLSARATSIKTSYPKTSSWCSTRAFHSLFPSRGASPMDSSSSPATATALQAHGQGDDKAGEALTSSGSRRRCPVPQGSAMPGSSAAPFLNISGKFRPAQPLLMCPGFKE